MRQRTAAITRALAAAGALIAAKPVPPTDFPDEAGAQLTRQAWRDRGVPICVGRLRILPTLSPDDIETICACTFDTYLRGHGTNPLPGLGTDSIPVAMESPLLSCTARARPDQRENVRRLGAIWPPGSPMIARENPGAPDPVATAGPKPVDEVDGGPPAQSETSGDSGGGFRDWVRSITLPAWLTGASALMWVALGILVLGLLIMRIRRRDPRNDLLGPPPSMRRGAQPQPPRRPDLPR